MFRNRILMGVALHPHTRLLRQTAEAAILFLIFTQNVSHISCGSKPISVTDNDGYASWAATQTTGVLGTGPFTVKPATVDVDTHRLAKRMDLELCLGKYEIHKNTIIRTGESQTLGGKYLQGLELDTTEECQRLCCETESCDVYVFEDKSDGYCYLFECGPPENFHCKFTRHANYTSAVLTVARNSNVKTTMAPSTTQVAGNNNFSQQEWELTSLKIKADTHDKMSSAAVGQGKQPTDVSGVYVVGTATATATSSGKTNVLATAGPVPMLGAEQIPPISVAFPQNVYPPHCGRFQFPCHSGECIAVYNACDGIPQCEDGSDEGPECSGATSTAKSDADAASANSLETKGQKIVSVPQYQPPVQQQATKTQLQPMPQPHQQQQPQQLVQQTLPGIVPPLINNREDAGAWETRKTATPHPQEQIVNDVDLKNRIFSHKGGIQVPTTLVNANKSPNSVQANTYANTNANNNPNINLNPAYNAVTLQRNGIYIPQMADLSPGSVYISQQQQQQIPPQQQYVVPIGMMPSNMQWQIQQSKQVALTPQAHMAQQQQALPLPLQPASPYNVNLVDQQQQVIPGAAKEATEQSAGYLNSPVDVTLLQHKAEITGPQQQSVVHVALPNESTVVAKSAPREQKSDTSRTADANAKVKEQNNDYEEDSTHSSKKKQKHITLGNLPKSEKVKSLLDPIESALEEQRQHVPVPSPVHEQYKLIHDNLGFEFRDHDGQSERPGGAMLSLTLGLLVTAALAILIGCRMRTVSRRTRRMGGKAPYSHEADFLVNGMYL